MTKSRKIILGSLLALVVVAFGAMAISSYYSNLSIIKVENQTDAVMSNVSVTLADKVIWTGTVAAGATETAKGTIEKPGPVGIAFDEKGQHVARLFAEAQPGRPEHGTLQVQSNLNVEYLWTDQ